MLEDFIVNNFDEELLFTVIDEYVSSMNQYELNMLEDFIVNNFGID